MPKRDSHSRDLFALLTFEAPESSGSFGSERHKETSFVGNSADSLC
jgi:hypothetical protein